MRNLEEYFSVENGFVNSGSDFTTTLTKRQTQLLYYLDA